MGKLLNEMGNCPFASPLIAPLILSNSMTKSDKIRLFNDRNLKFLIKLYQNVHNLLTIVLNSKSYEICFFDPGFRPNSNQIIRKFVVFLLNQVKNDEFLANLVDNCLRTCLDLLSTVWKTISNEFGLKNEKFVEILQEQKKLTEWNEISMSFDEIWVEKKQQFGFWPRSSRELSKRWTFYSSYRWYVRTNWPFRVINKRFFE